jgi:ActR/RegA family two-component response regulator
MSLETGKSVLDELKIGDERSSGSLTKSGKTVFLVDADDGYEMSVTEQMVFIDLAAATAFNITLPSVREAMGKLYAISPTFAAGSVTIADKDGDAAKGDISATTAQTIILYSTGYKWIVLFNSVTT